ncbi:hypothetical protein TP2_03835 [Thioclava pacifica DSM 10166]|uniref:tRNA(Ile)-lysidine synthase n=2 Tax=Thioclava pacifica TaxID=285109 RepID=A0A074J925_9RHOB|nr:hypothetical protein TP2_03835 [Thioclava pacifica DSM 10166]
MEAVGRGEITPEDAWLYHWADSAFLTFPQKARTRIGVAVSGGSDSMATLALLAQFHAVEAVTVDHGLRPEAADEAAFVARFCAERDIPHQILHWDGASAEGNLMDAARRARLSLIGTWARARGIGIVALGHTRDDQAETFLMRLAREAGLEGLSGMRRRFTAQGVLWARPFLMQTRVELRAYLTRHDIGWVEDPSNENERFERVKARKALAALRPLGITVEKITESMHHLEMAESALNFALGRLVDAHVRELAGDLVIDAQAFRHEIDPEMQRRLIVAALRWVSGADYAPRAAKVEAFLSDWQEKRDRTLHGCRITVTDREIRIAREARAVRDLRVPVGRAWDRWELTGPEAEGLEIAMLGAEGLRQCPEWRETGLPRASLLASPAIWSGESLVAAPLAGAAQGWTARISRDAFAAWLFGR